MEIFHLVDDGVEILVSGIPGGGLIKFAANFGCVDLRFSTSTRFEEEGNISDINFSI
jgi:hypothetical protein